MGKPLQLRLMKIPNLFQPIEGHVPKINEKGYWYTLEIQRALPLTQPLLKYFDQKFIGNDIERLKIESKRAHVHVSSTDI